MDECVDGPLPPGRLASASKADPAIIGLPMARLVRTNDGEDLHQRAIGLNERVSQQDFNLPVAPALGERHYPAHAFEFSVAVHDRRGVELVDRRSEHDFDEAVDMSAGAVDRQRHQTAALEPATKHQIMLALVGAVLFDRAEESVIIGRALSRRRQQTIDRCIAAMLIVDVDGPEQVEIAPSVPITHLSHPTKSSRSTSGTGRLLYA